jgi:hypothetical protein
LSHGSRVSTFDPEAFEETRPVPVVPAAPPEFDGAEHPVSPEDIHAAPAEAAEVVYVPLAVTVGDGFKLGCGFFLAAGLGVLLLLVVLSAIFALTSLLGMNPLLGR